MKKVLAPLFVAVLSIALATTVFGQTQSTATTSKKYASGSSAYPGAQSDEVFVTNISTTSYPVARYDTATNLWWYDFVMDDSRALQKNYNMLDWKTKRLGTVAYNRTGYVVADLRPVFVKKDEYEQFSKNQ